MLELYFKFYSEPDLGIQFHEIVLKFASIMS